MTLLQSCFPGSDPRLVERDALSSVRAAALIFFAAVEEAIAASYNSLGNTWYAIPIRGPQLVLSQGIRYLSALPRST